MEGFSFNKYLLKDIQISIKKIYNLNNKFSLKISLMLYSGSIDAEVTCENNKYNIEKYENNKQYIFNINKKNSSGVIEILIKITAKENSFFNIGSMLRIDRVYKDFLYTGSSYIFNLDNQTGKFFSLMNPRNHKYYYYNYYTGFKIFNCKLNITRIGDTSYPEISNKSLEIKDDYTQDIIPKMSYPEPVFLINITEKSTDNSSCLVNIYPYLIKIKEEYDSNSTEEIFIMDKEPQ